jgi:hypothetical protein
MTDPKPRDSDHPDPQKTTKPSSQFPTLSEAQLKEAFLVGAALANPESFRERLVRHAKGAS